MYADDMATSERFLGAGEIKDDLGLVALVATGHG